MVDDKNEGVCVQVLEILRPELKEMNFLQQLRFDKGQL